MSTASSLRRVRLRPASVVPFLLILVAPRAAAQAPPDVGAAVDAPFAWASPSTPGCVVAVAADGERLVERAYGMADLDRGEPLTPASRVDAGSVVKQVVAAAVLTLAEDGRLALDDDVRRYVPELPDPGAVVTLDHLLTHTSGVRDWTGLRLFASDDADALALVLRQRGLDFAPGTEWAYSNSGYVLLKEVVSRVAGEPFGAFAQRRLFEPLGMAATAYVDAPQTGDHPGRVTAYERDGEAWAPRALDDAERGGGGGLLTTAGDLLTWTEAVGDDALGAFASRALQDPARLVDGRTLGYGRGLFLDEVAGTPLVWHSGSAGAHKALTVRVPEADVSFGIVCNAGDEAPPMRFAGPLRQLFLATPEASPAPAPAGAGAADAEARAGLFLPDGPGEPLTLVARGGRLGVMGGPALVAVAADRYRLAEPALPFLSGDDVAFHFESTDAFGLVSETGRVTRYRRAEPVPPTAADLAAIAGRYESDELQAVFEVTAADDGLGIAFNGSPSFPFAPVAPDRFQFRRMVVRVVRGEAGAVQALELTTPAFRRVHLPRTEEPSGLSHAPRP